MQPTKIKTVKYKNNTYTIDERLKEFRSIINKKMMFIPFNSAAGKMIQKEVNKND